MKRLLALIALVAFGLASSVFAQTATTAKVVAVDGVKVQVTVAGEVPSWLKKGGFVKISSPEGKVIHVVSKVTEGEKQTFTLTLKEKTDIKAGDAVALQKGKPLIGC